MTTIKKMCKDRRFILTSIAILLFAIALSIFYAGRFGFNAQAAGKSTSIELRGAAAIEHLKQSGQYDSLQKALQAARYNVQNAATPFADLSSAYQAENPQNRFRSFFTPQGVTLAFDDITSNEQAQSLESTTGYDNMAESMRLRRSLLESKQKTENVKRLDMQFVGIGYNDDIEAVGAGVVQAQDNRVEIRRSDSITEWYVNKPDGLEHGFTLAQRPSPKVQDSNLRLKLALAGDIEAQMSATEDTVVFKDGERAIHYTGLKVYDARSAEIPARMRLAAGALWIEVNDQNAVYPLTIDPTFVFLQQLIAADGAATDGFGVSVSISGDTVVVGAYVDDIGANTDQGSAYVFVRSGNTWLQQQKLTAADGAAFDLFGISVAISSDTIVVGAKFDTIGANTNQGSAYIFVRSGSTWSQQQQLIAADGAAFDLFGISVSISSDTIVVGASFNDIGANTNQGSAYIFVRSGSTWSQQQKLIAADGAATDGLGFSVSISGDTVVASAYVDDIGANTNQGSAYIFVRSGSTWSQQQQLIATDGATSDRFGTSVSISGNTIVIGANLDAIGANINQGSAYIFAVGIAPTITCPANMMTSNTPGQCAANVAFNVATTGTPTPAVTCTVGGSPVTSPANFPVGVTTVTCTAANGVLPDASCSFTVTVVDTQPPVINCPQNVIAAAPPSCPTASVATVNYANPMATDNCPGVTVTCVPPSGSSFPVGATTVTCTAKDAANLTSQCSFSVKLFNVCVQDDGDANKVFLFNTQTGEYYFCCSGTVITGIGSVAKRGCVYTLTHNSADRRVQAQVDLSLFKGTASLQKPVGTATCSISDRDLRNNTCRCSP